MTKVVLNAEIEVVVVVAGSSSFVVVVVAGLSLFKVVVVAMETKIRESSEHKAFAFIVRHRVFAIILPHSFGCKKHRECDLLMKN